jgi:putative copper resistance protein D
VGLIVRWVHVLSAITWIGGMLFIALVLVPVTRGLDDAALRTRLVQESGRRFRRIAWIALALLVVTGLLNLWQAPGLLWTARFHLKVGLVGLAVILSAFHDYVLGPRAGLPGADPTARLRASWIARLNLAVALAIVLLGLALRD